MSKRSSIVEKLDEDTHWATADGPGVGVESKGPGQPSFDKKRLQDTISSNVVVSVVSKIIYLAVRFVLPPIILSYVTLAEYGIWATCFILIGYLGMGAFGVSNVYIRYIAEYETKGETGRISRLVSTGLVVVSAVCAVLLAALWFLLPAIIRFFHVPVELHGTATLLIFGTAAVFMLDLTLGAFAYVLHGLQRLVEQNAIWLVGVVLETILILVLLGRGVGIVSLLIAFAVRYAITIAAYVALCYRLIPGLTLGLKSFDRGYLRHFAHYGGIVQISGLLSMFVRSIEKVLAGALLGIQATGLFDIGVKFPGLAVSIPSAVNGAFLPAMTEMHTHGRRREMVKLYLKGSRYISVLTGLIMGFLAAFSAPIVTAWMGPDERFARAAFIMMLFTLPVHLRVVTGPASAIYRSIEKPGRELLFPVIQLLLVVVAAGLGYVIAGPSITMVALSVASAVAVGSLVAMGLANRFLGVRQSEFMYKVLLPGLVPYAMAALAAWGASSWVTAAAGDRWACVVVLAAVGVVYGVVTPLVIYRALCDWGEREYLRLQIRKTLGSLLGRLRGRS